MLFFPDPQWLIKDLYSKIEKGVVNERVDKANVERPTLMILPYKGTRGEKVLKSMRKSLKNNNIRFFCFAVYDITHVDKPYPPPPSFIKLEGSTDCSSSSSSSINSLPIEQAYDVACIDRRNGKPPAEFKVKAFIESQNITGQSPPSKFKSRLVFGVSFFLV